MEMCIFYQLQTPVIASLLLPLSQNMSVLCGCQQPEVV